MPSDVLHMEEHIDVAAPAATVWNVVGDFVDPSPWTVGLDNVKATGRSPGAIRRLSFQIGEIVERLEHWNGSAMTMSYALVSGPLPVEEYSAELRVTALSPTVSRVFWSARCKPREVEMPKLEGALRRTYRRNLDRLAGHVAAQQVSAEI